MRTNTAVCHLQHMSSGLRALSTSVTLLKTSLRLSTTFIALLTNSQPLSTMSATTTPSIPAGHKAVKERNATILLPTSNTTFLNPIQEFNRDLSVAVIKRFMEDSTDAARTKFESRRAKRTKKVGKPSTSCRKFRASLAHVLITAHPANASTEAELASKLLPFKPAKYTIIEALSATGLRSIRYAQELPEAG